MTTNGWDASGTHVLKTLERLDRNINKLDGRLRSVQEDMAMLKVKSGLWGAAAGAVPSAIAIAYMILK